ncbi:hypothetical protein CC78DRAFT_587060 [Lojkania enalia]|uniref:Uncharacterized protein n=1 Tax=Lojkania enalia TaxID=147567 RepID=A0A9P4MYH3_9PLEO|nr:hypothetical protein CC78DRAFT_587060 [Didymosphaeria enalia]
MPQQKRASRLPTRNPSRPSSSSQVSSTLPLTPYSSASILQGSHHMTTHHQTSILRLPRSSSLPTSPSPNLLSSNSTIHSSPASPGFPSITHGNLSTKGLDSANTKCELSYERTPALDLPFPRPKYHVWAGEVYESTSLIPEAYGPVTEFMEGVGSSGAADVLRSVETRREGGALFVDWGVCNSGFRELAGDFGVVGSGGAFVRHPGSRERSSIGKERKRGVGEAGMVEGRDKTKKVKERDF